MPFQNHRQDRPESAGMDGWDYLIVTASNDSQASAYRSQLDLRRRMGLLGGAREVLVVPDPQGRRVGSGGSTIYCLIELLSRHLARKSTLGDPQAWLETLSNLRVLIVHAGGDSRRLPAYSACGKLFIPVPGESDSALGVTLFDRQLLVYLALPSGPRRGGQVVLTAGDVLLAFDPSVVCLDREGIVGLGYLASPEEASHHGVYCVKPGGELRYFLQKPTVQQQHDQGAIDHYGQTILDLGVISLDAAATVALLNLCGVSAQDGALHVSGPVGQAVETLGMDFYREVCCALGQEATAEHHATVSHASGSRWDPAILKRTFDALHTVPLAVQVVPRCQFLHFGTTAQLISSGQTLLAHDYGVTQLDSPLSLGNILTDQADLTGAHAWVEACRIGAPVTLGGQNVMVGVNVDEPLALPAGGCLDVIQGRSRSGQRVWFVRCYGVTDAFKDSPATGATFCGMPIDRWLAAVGACAKDVWNNSPPTDQPTLWDGRFFPAEDHPQGYRQWLWMFDPASASDAQKRQWMSADRYSLAEIAVLTDQDAFFARRAAMRAEEVARSCRRLFRLDSGFSASELSVVLTGAANRPDLVRHILNEAQWHGDPAAIQRGGEPHYDAGAGGGFDAFIFPRIIHTLGSAIASLGSEGSLLSHALPGFDKAFSPVLRTWCQSLGLLPSPKTTLRQWAETAQSIAFDHLSKAIVTSGRRQTTPPTSALRTDEIVWGRAGPAGPGGWVDRYAPLFPGIRGMRD